MLISMTGYCSKNQQLFLSQAGAVQMTIELKTLNGRFFEAVTKLPGSLSHLEIAINSLVQASLIRGRVYLSIRQQGSGGKLTCINPSWSTIEQYLQASKTIKEKYGLTGEISLIDILQLPDVLVADEATLSPEDEAAIMAMVADAVAVVVEVRKAEGARLEKDMYELFLRCTSKLASIKELFAAEILKAKEQLNAFMALHANAEQLPSEAEEMQSSLRKMDIHEEIVRFASHLESLKQLFASPALEKGKRLDFIFQELLRETNTMMAKCLSHDISATGIDIKVELEKAREQGQNIL
jgi:uncharacterized protein (TIGR00255 family)